MTVSIPDALANEARQLAKADQLSVSALMTAALRRYLRARKSQELGGRVLALVGHTSVGADALELLEEGRRDART